MGLYQERIVPALIGMAMGARPFRPLRQRVVGAASGRTLEVGVGAGDNLGFYPPAVEELFALDPSARLLERARRRAPSGRTVRLLETGAEAIPLDDSSMDTVVMTWTACSIPDVPAALSEIRRVLKPSGRLLFVEHGRAPDAGVARWQDRLDPVWSRLAGGCHLNRRIDEALPAAGLRLEALTTGYGLPGPRIFTYLYEGAAVRR
jgi:SAM-dependent methyltransferase